MLDGARPVCIEMLSFHFICVLLFSENYRFCFISCCLLGFIRPVSATLVGGWDGRGWDEEGRDGRGWEGKG